MANPMQQRSSTRRDIFLTWVWLVARGNRTTARPVHLRLCRASVQFLRDMFGNPATAYGPNFVERKGTLFLRSDHKKYSRDTLANGW